jgi:hypothetical protein
MVGTPARVQLERFAAGCSEQAHTAGINPAAHYIRPQTALIEFIPLSAQAQSSGTSRAGVTG